MARAGACTGELLLGAQLLDPPQLQRATHGHHSVEEAPAVVIYHGVTGH